MKKNSILTMLLLGLCLVFSSCLILDRKSAIEGYEWLEGVWENPEPVNSYYKVKISKNKYSVSCSDECWACKNKPIKIGYRFAMSEMREILQLDVDGGPIIEIVDHGKYITFHDSEWGGPMLTKTSEPMDFKGCVEKYFKALFEVFD